MANAIADELLVEGNGLEDGGDFAAALARYERARALAPDYARVHINVGNALSLLQRSDEAEASYRQGIRLAPENAHIRFNLAGLFSSRGDRAGAEAELRHALQIEPGLAEASVALALILSANGRNAEAESQLRIALLHRPQYSGAALNLGKLLTEQDRFDEAIPWMVLGKDVAKDSLSWMLFALNNRSDLSRPQIFERHLKVGAAITRLAGHPYSTWENDSDPERRLRIGYVSADFKLHPVGMLIKKVLDHHDPNTVEIHCYSESTPDFATEILRKRIANWHETSGVTDDEFAERVRRDRIDILIDLSGHTNNNRLFAFARHPAPVQATWMGYLNTTALAAMDYRICDRYTDPEGESEAYYTERLVRLPNSQWCYEPWFAPKDFVRHTRSPENIRFGSVNRHKKISAMCVELWAEILRREPAAELSILDVPSELQDALLGRFVGQGLDPKRVLLFDRRPLEGYYATIGNLDIALDTFPYNGGTTTLDTLWMGTPLVALKGDSAVSRSAYSILNTLGLQELIAHSPSAYVDLNVKLARDPAWRDRLRLSLRERLLASPLMDGRVFAANVESCYRDMWRSWCMRAA